MADDIPSKILDAASVWVERLKRGLSASEERALADWLGNDPVRHAALRRAELAWDRSSETDRWASGLNSPRRLFIYEADRASPQP